jgi:hypothetical protein
MATDKVIYAHEDRLGRVLKLGDYVGFAENSGIAIAKIDKMTAKMVHLRLVPTGRWSTRLYQKYAHQTIYIDGADLTMYLLRN